MRRYVVRIVTAPEPVPDAFELDRQVLAGPMLEYLEAAGLVQVHRKGPEGACFDLIQPMSDASYVGPGDWADETASKLRDKGVNAVRAPPWVKL